MNNNNNNNNYIAPNFKPIKLAIDVALFIDNDIKYIKDVQQCGPKMDVLHVGGQQGDVIDLNWSSQELAPFLKAVEKGEEGSKVITLMKEKGKEGVPYDSQSGIKKEHYDKIKEWVLKIKKNRFHAPAVLFDYDRTLTVVEGTDLSFFEENKDRLTMEGFLEFHMGGKERLKMLRDLFFFLNDQGVAMFVLTNNGQCGLNPLFQTLNEQLFDPYNVSIICGRAKNYRGKKQKAAADVLPSVCRLSVKSEPVYEAEGPVNHVEGPIYADNNENENTSMEAIDTQLQALSTKGKGGRRRNRKTKRNKRKAKKTRKH